MAAESSRRKFSEYSMQVDAYMRELQSELCKKLENIDHGKSFLEDQWDFSGGSGGGISRVLENGKVFEKAGVNFSSIEGSQLPAAGTERLAHLNDRPFRATGVSVVIHPRNPYVPTTHMNLRFIQVDNRYWWFGGGFDLTPYYGFVEDAVHWHRMAAAACEGFGDQLYDKLKSWCDQYFYLKHRGEMRGIGGLFFDDYTAGGFSSSFQFLQNVGKHFMKAYLPIVERRMHLPFGERERQFQLIRRGRYVEFNLVYDRGTLFGLQSKGRIESILMSLPPSVSWRYDWKPQPDSEEQKLSEFLRPREWLAER